MFRNVPAAEITEPARDVTDDLIPLSIFGLDYPQPVEGWAVFLSRKAIAFLPDDLGRDSIRRGDAKRLLDERRADELRRAKLRELAEQEAVEADQQRRSQMPRGVPWYKIPADVLPATALAAADKAAQPRRTPSHTEWLFGEVDGMVFHSLQGTDES